MAQAQREAELAACTFKPAVNPLPAGQQSRSDAGRRSSASFAERAERWKADKVSEAARRKAEAERREVEACTFKPNTNTGRRRRASSASRGVSGTPGAVHERLFRAATPSRAAKMRGDGAAAAVAGLGPRQRPPTAEEREMAEFTGKPRVNANRGRSATPVKSRYMAAARASALSVASDPAEAAALGSSRHQPTGMEECTFAPRTNRVRNDAVRAYTATGVFDRLSEEARIRQTRQAMRQRRAERDEEEAVAARARAARGGPPAAGKGGVVAAAGLGGSSVMGMQAHLTGEAGDGNAEAKAAEASPPRADAAERGRRRSEFLQRQRDALQRREEHAEQVRRATEPRFAPELCARSLDMVTEESHGQFLDRVRKTAVRREHETLAERAERTRDPQCTFQPRINPVSKAMPSRSVSELSRGDAVQRETRARLVRLRLEQERAADNTFRPSLNPTSARAEGRLRVMEDPAGYIERVQREAAVASDRQRRAAEEKRQQETDECTFHPEVHDAPAYVKRIARSMALTRVVRPAPEVTERPEWR